MAQLVSNRTPAQHAQMLALSQDLPRLFRAPTTKSSQKKEILRHLIEDITLRNRDAPYAIEVAIRWKSGVVSRHRAARPALRPQATSDEVIGRIESLYRTGADKEIAAILNA